MLRAYKYRIYPSDDQKVLFAKTFGCCRFVYNWALNLKIEAYKNGKESLSNVYLTNRMKSELKQEYEWLKEVNSQSLQSSLLDILPSLKERDSGVIGSSLRCRSYATSPQSRCPDS